MIGMIGVCEELLDGFGPEEPADHCTSAVRGDGKRYCRANQLPFHMGSSIAGLLRRIAEGDWRDGLIRFIWSVSFIWLVRSTTHQRNKRDETGLARHALRCVARAARRKASNNLRWRGCRSKRNSGCHWMPRKKRLVGDSIASTIPSGARALATNDGATALTD